jgi:hypothetical protein
MSEMRALSVRQPWAWAICHGKDVENRSRGTRHRGLLAIHASKSAPFKADLDDPRIIDAIAANGFRVDDPPSAQGAVVAVAELVGCHSDETEEPRTSCSPWAAQGQYHWGLRNVRPLADPVPCRGALGLWRLPEGVEKLVRAQLEAAQRPT